ncbi:MAG: hypothetical protein ACK56K_07990, partial [Akkermansiaceae bacterium]
FWTDLLKCATIVKIFMPKTLRVIFLLPFVFTSCGTMKSVKETAFNATRSVKETTVAASQNVADFALMRPKVAVVQAREKDMKQMPLGKERALAFDQQRKRSFWSFALPNFKEPVLPTVTDEEPNGSLLPPKS